MVPLESEHKLLQLIIRIQAWIAPLCRALLQIISVPALALGEGSKSHPLLQLGELLVGFFPLMLWGYSCFGRLFLMYCLKNDDTS